MKRNKKMSWKKTINKILTGLIIIVLVTFFGCAAFQDIITPCYIELETIDWSGEKPTSFLPFTTLWDNQRINRRLDFVFDQDQTQLIRQVEDNEKKYGFLKRHNTIHVKNATEFKENVFSPIGLGAIFPCLGTLYLGGKYIKSPKEKELEKNNDKTKNNNK